MQLSIVTMDETGEFHDIGKSGIRVDESLVGVEDAEIDLLPEIRKKVNKKSKLPIVSKVMNGQSIPDVVGILLTAERESTPITVGCPDNGPEDTEELEAEEIEWGMSDMLNPPHSFRH